MEKIDRKIAQFFSVLSDETRLNIVLALVKGPKNVSEIHEVFKKSHLTLPAISQQLRHLQNNGIVTYRKNGREKVFRLTEGFCWCIVKDAIDHLKSGKNCKCKECMKVKTKFKEERK